MPGLARLRYTSPHPRHATASLARAHAELDVLARHVHLPVQSGSDRVLRRMIRRYTRAEYVARAERLARGPPGPHASTDVIVGFPGETEDDFAQTLSLVREVGFVSLFGFKYSPRPLTPALRLKDDVPEEAKSERLARLFEVVEAPGRGAPGDARRHAAARPGRGRRARARAGDLSRDRVQGRTERNEIRPHRGARGGGLGGRRSSRSRSSRANRHSLDGGPDRAPARRRAPHGPAVLRAAPASWTERS